MASTMSTTGPSRDTGQHQQQALELVSRSQPQPPREHGGDVCGPSTAHGLTLAPSAQIMALFRHSHPAEQLFPHSYPVETPLAVRQWHPPILMPSHMRELQQGAGESQAAQAAAEPSRLAAARRRHSRQAHLRSTALAAACAEAAAQRQWQATAAACAWQHRPVGAAVPAA